MPDIIVLVETDSGLWSGWMFKEQAAWGDDIPRVNGVGFYTRGQVAGLPRYSSSRRGRSVVEIRGGKIQFIFNDPLLSCGPDRQRRPNRVLATPKPLQYVSPLARALWAEAGIGDRRPILCV